MNEMVMVAMKSDEALQMTFLEFFEERGLSLNLLFFIYSNVELTLESTKNILMEKKFAFFSNSLNRMSFWPGYNRLSRFSAICIIKRVYTIEKPTLNNHIESLSYHILFMISTYYFYLYCIVLLVIW